MSILNQVLSKSIKDLNDTEKDFIVKSVTVYGLSDHFDSLKKDLEKEAEEMREEIKAIYKDKDRSRELVASQSDKEQATIDYMIETAGKLDDSDGGKLFASKLLEGARAKEKTNIDTIEPFFDQYCYTELDVLKLKRVLRLSVKQWINQVVTQHSKEVPVPEEQGAY